LGPEETLMELHINTLQMSVLATHDPSYMQGTTRHAGWKQVLYGFG
jgi:hypothetical protein